MRCSFRLLTAIFFTLVAAFFSTGCGQRCTPEHPCCEAGKTCACGPGVESCTISCAGLASCEPVCDAQFKTCDIDCAGAACKTKCSGGDNCTTFCGDNCSQSCSSASGCKTECGDECEYDCRSVSTCDVIAGNNSKIHCESVGDCKALCKGDCKVDCPMSGSCSLECEDESGKVTPGEVCSPTSRACGGC